MSQNNQAIYRNYVDHKWVTDNFLWHTNIFALSIQNSLVLQHLCEDAK